MDVPKSATKTKRSHNLGLRYPPNDAWPVVMRADMAAAFVDARSISAFLRGVGTIYPRSVRGAGRRGIWSKAALEAAVGIDAVDDLADLI